MLKRRVGGSLESVKRGQIQAQASLRVSFDAALSESSDGSADGSSGDRLRQLQQTYAVWRSFRQEQQQSLSLSRSFSASDGDGDRFSAALTEVAAQQQKQEEKEKQQQQQQLEKDSKKPIESVSSIIARFAKATSLQVDAVDTITQRQSHLLTMRRLSYQALNHLVHTVA